jgi:hypothetical protein
VATNPLLAEINNLSPGAKAALASAHQAATQATAPPPLVPNSTAPKLGPAVGPKAPMPDMGPPPTPAGLAPPNSGPMPAAIATPGPNEAPPSVMAPRGTIPADTAELARKESTGSGISQIHGMIENSALGQAHPLLGKILGWGAQIPAMLGDIAGSAVAPEITRNLPGTEYHHDVLVKQGQRQVAGDEANAAKEAETRETNARAGEVANPADTVSPLTTDNGIYAFHTKGGGVTPLTDQSGEQLQSKDKEQPQNVHVLPDGHVISITKGPDGQPQAQVVYKGDPAVKTEVKQLEIGGKPHQVLVNSQTGETVKDLGVTGEKPTTVNVNAGTNQLDKEIKQYGGGHQKAVDTAGSQLEKIEDAENMIRGNAEAQALGIPKVLTALVGGQGTGVRITQPELQAIAKARGIQGDFEGFLNKASGQGALTKTQQQQLTQIMEDVKNRIQQKLAIHSGALDTMQGAGSREEIIQADKDARKKLSDMESGGGASSGGSSGKAVSLKAAMGLPAMKGKSEAEVRQAIQSSGHQVVP